MKDDTTETARDLLLVGKVDEAVQVLLDAGHKREAAVILERVQDHRSAGQLFGEQRAFEDAARCFLAAGEHRRAAIMLRDAGDLPGAERVLREAKDRVGLIGLLIEQGRTADAEALALGIKPDEKDYTQAQGFLGRILGQRADWVGARAAYERALAAAGIGVETARIALLSAQAASRAGDLDGAQRQIQDLSKRGLLTGPLRDSAERLLSGLVSGRVSSRHLSGARRAPSSSGMLNSSPAVAAEALTVGGRGKAWVGRANSLANGNGGVEGGVTQVSATLSRGAISGGRSDRSAAPRAADDKGAVLPYHPYYRFVRRIGAGGMGVVYEVLDERDSSRIVVKLLQNKTLNTDTARDLFLHEAMLLSFLKHTNIVAVFDYGHIDDHPFLAMEFVEGSDLGQVVRAAQSQRMSLSFAQDIMKQLADALDHAHRQGIIHRDIKLSNVMLTRGGVAKLLDFGLAKAVSTAMEVTDELMGTPLYMAPELIRRETHDHRVDIYAVGVMLYRLLVGVYPFQGDDVLRQHVHRVPQDPLLVFPALPMEVGGVILRCLEKRPEDRFETAGDVAAALTGF